MREWPATHAASDNLGDLGVNVLHVIDEPRTSQPRSKAGAPPSQNRRKRRCGHDIGPKPEDMEEKRQAVDPRIQGTQQRKLPVLPERPGHGDTLRSPNSLTFGVVWTAR